MSGRAGVEDGVTGWRVPEGDVGGWGWTDGGRVEKKVVGERGGGEGEGELESEDEGEKDEETAELDGGWGGVVGGEGFEREMATQEGRERGDELARDHGGGMGRGGEG